MKIHGRSSVSEFLGDRVVYRNLDPVDPRLFPLEVMRKKEGLPGGPIPRKGDPEYAQVVVHLLRQARALVAPGVSLERLVYLGDTRMSDGGAFASLCRAGGWTGRAFIGSETSAAPALKVEPAPGSVDQTLTLANRWAALADFDRSLALQGFPVDEKTAVVVDLDKTALGGRGRNSHVIDAARVQAVHETVAGLLGDRFDPLSFRVAYNRLCQPEFHPFTTDNQDYLAYMCLVLGSGLFELETLIEEVRSGKLQSFGQFIDRVDAREGDLTGGLSVIHQEIYGRVQAGDPTPFKAFRRNEYRLTIAKMGCLPDTTPVEEILTGEIVLTQEVRQAALGWQARGALLFGLSDKPDEASLPTPELAAGGYVALHRKETHVVGE